MTEIPSRYADFFCRGYIKEVAMARGLISAVAIILASVGPPGCSNGTGGAPRLPAEVANDPEIAAALKSGKSPMEAREEILKIIRSRERAEMKPTLLNWKPKR